ncbi:MAG: nucleotidyltransferase family protein [Phycisphaeraceae bacterium]
MPPRASIQRDEVLSALRVHVDELRALGVRHISLFGSTARGEAGPTSDVDLLVDIQRPFGLGAVGAIQFYLEEILGLPVDLVPENCLDPRIREHVMKDLIRAA